MRQQKLLYRSFEITFHHNSKAEKQFSWNQKQLKQYSGEEGFKTKLEIARRKLSGNTGERQSG